jgi:hypothetical protein
VDAGPAIAGDIVCPDACPEACPEAEPAGEPENVPAGEPDTDPEGLTAGLTTRTGTATGIGAFKRLTTALNSPVREPSGTMNITNSPSVAWLKV